MCIAPTTGEGHRGTVCTHIPSTCSLVQCTVGDFTETRWTGTILSSINVCNTPPVGIIDPTFGEWIYWCHWVGQKCFVEQFVLLLQTHPQSEQYLLCTHVDQSLQDVQKHQYYLSPSPFISATSVQSPRVVLVHPLPIFLFEYAWCLYLCRVLARIWLCSIWNTHFTTHVSTQCCLCFPHTLFWANFMLHCYCVG
jgi:hypothetical protein